MAIEQRKRFGRYELQARIGRGGLAETWRARRVGAADASRRVLLKKVLPELAGDEAFISTLIDEARLAATLSHDNVARVLDAGEVNGESFLAMEYVEGQPLHRILKRALGFGFTCLPVPIATQLAVELCRGLHAAHTQTDDAGQPLGLVHGGVSPDNVFVSYAGQVKLVDLGLARARALRDFEAAPGGVKGKYLFFSPEQARGEAWDARTDVWATGVVLFHAVCGRLPLQGSEQEVLRELSLGQPLPRARDVRPDLPARLDAILQKALAVKKEERFESAQALGDALAGFLSATAPRFSATSVVYLLRELFRTELAAEGRDTRVPPAFAEELSVWRVAPEVPRAPDPETVLRTEGLQALRTAPGEPPGPAEAAEPAPTDGDRESEGGILQNGIGMSTAVGAVAALAVLAVLWVTFTRLKADWATPEAPPRHGPPASFRPVPPPTQVAEAPAPKPSTEEPEAPSAASWPVESFQLEARRHVLKVSPGLAALGALDAESDWSLVETTRLNAVDRDKAMPALFFLLSGPGVDTSAAVGPVSRKPAVLQGASRLMLFTLGPTSSEDLPERTVSVTRLRTGEVQRHVLHPEWMTATVDRAFVLSGLRPEESYRLTLEPVGEGAFTRGREHGPALTVACVQRERPEDMAPEQVARFLVSQGAPVRVSAMSGLACGFVDDDPADNHGAVRLFIEKARTPPERGITVVR